MFPEQVKTSKLSVAAFLATVPTAMLAGYGLAFCNSLSKKN